MVTIRFSASPGVLIEEAGTAIDLRSQLDQALPVSELTATVDNTVEPSNSALAQFAKSRPNPIRGTNQGDRLIGTTQDDLLEGLGGDDQLIGLAGTDGLFGNAGDDVLFGGAGSDTLRGAAGSDTLRGDGGEDVFVIERGVGVDTIVDFRNNRDGIGIAVGVSFGQLDIVQQGRDTLIRLGRDELAVFQNVRANQITAADFSIQV